MNNANYSAGELFPLSRLAALGAKTLVPLASVSLLLAACGGGGGSGGGGQAGPTPILQAGMQRQYAGTTTRSIVYANPSGNQQNNILTYNFNESVNVLQAPANAPAAFDVRSTYTYAITQDPGTGTVPISETSDVYENLIVNGSAQATSTVAQSVTTVQNDETSEALGNGPYIATTTSQYSYPTPIPGATFPLQTGASFSLPLAELVNTSYVDINASGSAPSNGSNVGYSSQETKNSDGSFNTQTTRINGVSLSTIVHSDGSASFSSNGGTNVYVATIGVPVQANGAYAIPVNYTTTAPTASNVNYAPADWYPGNGLPPSPLASETKTVIEPVTTLPAACDGARVQPDMFEIDTSQTSLATTGSYLVSTTRAFNSNGVVVCSLLQQVSTSYNVYTGAVLSTTTTQTTSWLTGLSPSM